MKDRKQRLLQAMLELIMGEQQQLKKEAEERRAQAELNPLLSETVYIAPDGELNMHGTPIYQSTGRIYRPIQGRRGCYDVIGVGCADGHSLLWLMEDKG